jgi:hypothetical protein
VRQIHILLSLTKAGKKSAQRISVLHNGSMNYVSRQDAKAESLIAYSAGIFKAGIFKAGIFKIFGIIQN